jgi:hypothetical protein
MDTPYEKLLGKLADAEVKFIVAGGLAVALNGFVRTTEDVDILVDSAPGNIARLLKTLRTFGAGHSRELSLADFSEVEGAVRIVEDFPLDIFTVMQGKKYGDLIPRAHSTKIGPATIHFLNAETLMELKKTSHREKDKIDVAALKRIQQENKKTLNG